ncbi:hypothetical protein DFH11DRAFT_1546400 [Phellopilus nigrolimitatus]|nr:hypothetical protein DFH11DRAFT_1546400 [Phellopilus nigrolimitatus]
MDYEIDHADHARSVDASVRVDEEDYAMPELDNIEDAFNADDYYPSVASYPANDSAFLPGDDDSGGDSANEHSDGVDNIGDYAADKNKSKNALLDWIPLRDSLLYELHRHDGLQRTLAICSRCGDDLNTPLRCKTCFQSGLTCLSCIIEEHASAPLHCVEEWCGVYWKPTSLGILGLVVHIGHMNFRCPAPETLTRTLTVIHTNGIHRVKVLFCACGASAGEASLHYNQLIRVRWFPASSKKPQTVVSFDCVEYFHILTLQGKLTAYDYYQSLVYHTDNTDTDPPPRRYEEFMRVARLWRHLKMLKRAGVGLCPGGVAVAGPGSCAVECPACPHAETLRHREDDAIGSRDESWLDTQFVMLDANFRLKCKDRKIDDPSLGNGLSYYVENKAYMTYVNSAGLQTEMNVCDSGLHAVDHANTRGGSAYSTSGVGACQCRHMMVRPNGVGDLQRGERYCNMDFVFWSAVRRLKVPRLLISYDIACQWNRHLFARHLDIPEELQFPTETTRFAFVIPKFHISAHGKSCQSKYSLNYRRDMGRTDGENIERGWAWMNPASLSTREMGPGARRDTLDDQWSFWNWRILVKLGTTLARRLDEATLEARSQRASHEQFTMSFATDNIAAWSAMIDAWNIDPQHAPDPYSEPEHNTTIIDVRRQLNDLEGAETASGVLPLHKTSATQFLVIGIELEEQQRALRLMKAKTRGNTRVIAIEEKDVALCRKIALWKAIQQVYMPCVAITPRTPDGTDNSDATAPSVTAVDIRLSLPSSLTPAERDVECLSELGEKERRLHMAQADDALESLRKHLRVAATLFDHRMRQTAGTGTRPNTRMVSLLTRYNDKVERDAERYRAARAALVSLDPLGDWKLRFHSLRPSHIRYPTRDQEDVGEGRRKISWIWKNVAGSPNDIQEGLRVEWAKSLARAERWEEETMLVKEEMRRVLVFLDIKSIWWRALAHPCVVEGDKITESGMKAYAYKQAAIRQSLADDFASLWLRVYADHGLGVPSYWPERYQSVIPVQKQVRRRRERTKLHRRAMGLDEVDSGESGEE